MAQKGTEPLDSGIRTDCESITGSRESINSLTDGPASASASTQSHQSSHLQDSENAHSLDEVLANFPSDGVDTEVKDLEEEVALLKNGMQELNNALERSEVENIELRTKVNDLEGQVSELSGRLDHIIDLLLQKARDQTTKDKEQEETHLAVVGAVNNQRDLLEKFVKGLQEKMKQLESKIHAEALLVEDLTKGKDQQERTNRALVDEHSQLKRSVNYLLTRDRENQQAHTAQQNTNQALVRGANLQDDRTTAVKQDLTDLDEKTERRMQQLDKKLEQQGSRLDTVTVTANSAIEGVNELNISGGLQQADGNDGDNEPVSD